MKQYLYSTEGVRQVPEDVLLRCREQGGFMNDSGPVSLPIRLGKPEADGVGELLQKGKNFAFWFSPDFRVIFTTRDGAVDTAGKWWKIRFEWRSVNSQGRASVSIARFDRRVPPEAILPALENAFTDMAGKIAEAHAAMDGARPGSTIPRASLNGEP